MPLQFTIQGFLFIDYVLLPIPLSNYECAYCITDALKQ